MIPQALRTSKCRVQHNALRPKGRGRHPQARLLRPEAETTFAGGVSRRYRATISPKAGGRHNSDESGPTQLR